ncbi:hypothetical protein TNIN_454811 [Trichonephila inaurata madagascariensis]|uniref:Uncharacterized protein n=1 Tax=Trichonephila inaurata madagascariensis TaxID=2747483 RepID=A0A8X6Y1S1_9ARAC|nr:hypothetical protein TNIN_454811 [Trichonephila inaurata madagascariensis]
MEELLQNNCQELKFFIDAREIHKLISKPLEGEENKLNGLDKEMIGKEESVSKKNKEAGIDFEIPVNGVIPFYT